MSCGCNSRSVFSGVDFCREGISDCCCGLKSVRQNNIKNGTDRIRNGICKCRRGLSIIQCATSEAQNSSSSLSRYIRKCFQELSNIKYGRCEIIRNNVENGTNDVSSAVCLLGQLIEEINSNFENMDNCCRI